jgi:DNA-binding protein HU-beta
MQAAARNAASHTSAEIARRAQPAARAWHTTFQRMGTSTMNKADMVEHIAKSADISKAAAGRALEALIAAVRTTLKKNGSVTLVGFGTFQVSKRKQRTGRNPRTNEAIKIPAAKVPKFKPGKALKDAVK